MRNQFKTWAKNNHSPVNQAHLLNMQINEMKDNQIKKARIDPNSIKNFTTPDHRILEIRKICKKFAIPCHFDERTGKDTRQHDD
jgi:hypothetical protein